MKIALTTICAALLLMTGCATTGGSTNGPTTRAGTYQNAGFSWQPWPGTANLYMVSYDPGSSVRLSNGQVVTGGTMDCVRMGGPLMAECYNGIVAANRQAGFSNRTALVNAARQAIQAEGHCNWMGYDPALDARTRAMGALAAQNDNRLFFVQLSCR